MTFVTVHYSNDVVCKFVVEASTWHVTDGIPTCLNSALRYVLWLLVSADTGLIYVRS